MAAIKRALRLRVGHTNDPMIVVDVPWLMDRVEELQAKLDIAVKAGDELAERAPEESGPWWEATADLSRGPEPSRGDMGLT
ncbi:hypothetical protein [Blastococcus sp. VKM Ac-2987]|uniref:hypothetical protein n=1 Tax=Blastococcus sp. VKM Ac-2987 TaxID=3004141 RepID=UPI0022AB7BF4|nr:hypothetical protein [Blastococcus sp. VKM Ac-2987]MCZ2857437.1 hypothetical protein [Blastococcus sp. VKM Ac-2987]